MTLEAELAQDMVTELNFEFTSGSAVIEGYLIKPETRMETGSIRLTVESAHGTDNRSLDADADGYYQFDTLPAGAFTLSTTYGGFMNSKSVKGALEEGKTQRVDLDLTGGVTINCYVQNAPENSMIMATISQSSGDDPGEFSLLEMEESTLGFTQVANGIATFPGMEPGTYDITVVIIDADTLFSPDGSTNEFVTATTQVIVGDDSDSPIETQVSF